TEAMLTWIGNSNNGRPRAHASFDSSLFTARVQSQNPRTTRLESTFRPGFLVEIHPQNSQNLVVVVSFASWPEIGGVQQLARQTGCLPYSLLLLRRSQA